MFLLTLPTNAFLSAAVLSGLLQSETVMIFAGITVIFIEMMKTLVMATAAKQATIEFALSLMLLLGLALYVQSFNGWGLNLITVCVYIQFLDTISGFIGTFLLARRDKTLLVEQAKTPDATGASKAARFKHQIQHMQVLERQQCRPRVRAQTVVARTAR